MRRKSNARGIGRFAKIFYGSAYAEPTHPRRIAGGDSSPVRRWRMGEKKIYRSRHRPLREDLLRFRRAEPTHP